MKISCDKAKLKTKVDDFSQRNNTRAREIRYLSWIGISWLILSLLHFGAAWIVPNAVLRASSFPLLERLALISREMLLMLVLTVVVCLPLMLSASSRYRLLKIGGATISFLLVTVFVYVYAAGWYSFVSVGQFFGIEGVRMWAANPRQFNEHIAQIDPLVVVIFPLIALVTAMVLFGILRVLRRADRAFSLLSVTLPVFAFIGWISLLLEYHPTSDSPTLGAEKARDGVIYWYPDLLATVQETQVGPLTRVIYDLWHATTAEPENVALANVEVIHSPIVTMDQYLIGVDQSTLKKMNVVVVLVESLRPDELQSFTGSRPVMPEVDAVAKEAVLFPDAYAQSSHSNGKWSNENATPIYNCYGEGVYR